MKLTILHYIAKALGLLVHVDGMPYGVATTSSPKIAPHSSAIPCMPSSD